MSNRLRKLGDFGGFGESHQRLAVLGIFRQRLFRECHRFRGILLDSHFGLCQERLKLRAHQHAPEATRGLGLLHLRGPQVPSRLGVARLDIQALDEHLDRIVEVTAFDCLNRLLVEVVGARIDIGAIFVSHGLILKVTTIGKISHASRPVNCFSQFGLGLVVDRKKRSVNILYLY